MSISSVEGFEGATEKELVLLNVLRKLVCEEKLEEDCPLPISNFTLMRFVVSKKTEEKAVPAVRSYAEFLKKLDYSQDWDDIVDIMELPCMAQQYPYGRDLNGAVLCTGGTEGYYPAKIGTGNVLLGYWLTTEHMQQTEEQVRSGVSLLFDCDTFGWANWHAETEKESTEQMQNTWPVRLKFMALYNTGWVVKSLFKMFSFWLSPKMKERLKVLDKEDISSLVDPSQLDPLFGGTSTSTTEDWLVVMKQFYMDIQDQVKKRMGKLPTGTGVYATDPELTRKRKEKLQKKQLKVEKKEAKKEAKAEKKDKSKSSSREATSREKTTSPE